MIDPTCGSFSLPRFHASARVNLGMPKHFARIACPLAVTSERRRHPRPHASPVSGSMPKGNRSFQLLTVFTGSPLLWTRFLFCHMVRHIVLVFRWEAEEL